MHPALLLGLTSAPVATFLKHCMTGQDGQTYDVVRVCTLFGVLGFIVLAAMNWREFDPQAYGIGLGTILGGAGAGIMFKKDTEPRPA